MSEIRGQLERIEQMCYNLINDQPFKQFLSLVLLIGNYLNAVSHAPYIFHEIQIKTRWFPGELRRQRQWIYAGHVAQTARHSGQQAESNVFAFRRRSGTGQHERNIEFHQVHFESTVIVQVTRVAIDAYEIHWFAVYWYTIVVTVTEFRLCRWKTISKRRRNKSGVYTPNFWSRQRNKFTVNSQASIFHITSFTRKPELF